MENKVLSDLRKHMKSDIIKNDYTNFDESCNSDNIFITKHARERAKQRGVNTKDVLLNKGKAGNIIVNNKVVTVLGCKGNGVSRIERQCVRCNHKYMSSYKGKKSKCRQCLDKENARLKNNIKQHDKKGNKKKGNKKKGK